MVFLNHCRRVARLSILKKSLSVEINYFFMKDIEEIVLAKVIEKVQNLN